MLYKKVHRQYLREFRIGRKYRYGKNGKKVYKITSKPQIEEFSIFVGCWRLIPIKCHLRLGQLWHKEAFIWLD